MTWTCVVGVVVAFGLTIRPAAAQEAANNVGSVTEVGIGGFYDPFGWVPYRVNVEAPGGVAGNYRLRVSLQDLDGDNVRFERPVSLAAGSRRTFWGYFKLPPQNPSLIPEEDLRVTLTDDDGNDLARLDVQARPPDSTRSDDRRTIPARVILLVGGEGGGFYPGNGELTGINSGDLLGITALNTPIGVRPEDLPDQAIGYDAVHTVVWQDGDPTRLLDGGGERMDALLTWIAQGGRLVVTHRSDWQALEPIFSLLPVTPIDAVDLADAAPLGELPLTGVTLSDRERFTTVSGPVRFILSVAKDDAVVEETFTLGDTGHPLLARRGYGFGSVTWLATDLANRNLLGRRPDVTVGWTAIWARLLDVGDTPVIDPDERDDERYDANQARLLATLPQNDVQLSGRGAALVTLVVLFFIGYWLLAGPGVFFFLKHKKKASLSWWAFGVIAAGAALLTIGLTNLVLRGPAELKHVSVLRVGPVAPSVVFSDLGLYIPRDGPQTIGFGETGGRDATDEVGPTQRGPASASLTGLIPPNRGGPLGARTSPVSYRIDLSDGDSIDVPYRSSLKKFEARFSGPVKPAIEGQPVLRGRARFPEGLLVNTSGYDLTRVHIVYKQFSVGRPEYLVLYVPQWRDGGTIGSLAAMFNPQNAADRPNLVAWRAAARAGPPGDEPVQGRLSIDWAGQYWYLFSGVRQALTNTAGFDDWSRENRISPMLLSLHDLLPPMTNNAGRVDAVRMLAGGADEWDVSAAVSAGRLVIIGEARESDVPMPLTVEGRPVEGDGTTIVQVVLPMTRIPAAPDETDDEVEATENRTEN
jgi:hypothetical protein